MVTLAPFSLKKTLANYPPEVLKPPKNDAMEDEIY